ncbi:type 4b pilus protein PilO2 [Pusillimonas sp. SM2304]|uniref:type 4b pilus protein PilO2 n=1 Tax=Pusillimonas sp. SM2304 TaxID=3073241 RepID=UPI00287672FC|nr:type 4b pilus protein PilO2 [Pusillimonas sp. SM2304]MDS1141892.1 type 4b pilus protein PilO2 [Pusillimonas sp. SM2304]
MAHIAEPLLLPRSSCTLVFGLHWFPLVGSRSGKAGRRLARQHRSTHSVLPEGELGAIGVVALKNRALRKTSLYSAAQNVGQLFTSGTIAALLEVERVGYWLVAVHEGAVVARTDQLYRNKEDAAEVIDSLRQAYPQLRVLLTPEDGLPTLEAIEAASSSRSLLQPVRRWPAIMPWPVQGFVLALILVLLVPRVWQVFDYAQPAAAGQAQPEPEQAWRAAVARSGSQRRVHGVQGTTALLDAFHALPVGLGGWLLRRADCRAEGQRWHCQARYERSGPQASNRSFLALAPPSWTIAFSSLDHVAAHWQAEAYGLPLTRLKLPATAEQDKDLLSALQGIMPGFAQMRIGRPGAIPLSVPTDHQGQALERPAGQAVYVSRPVHVSGPLRSASLFLPHAAFAAWEKATLTLSQAERPGLKDSRLNLSLQGVFYETDQIMDDVSAVRCAGSGAGHCAGQRGSGSAADVGA